MNNYYIIAIGGTGMRIVKALMYLCIADCFPKNAPKLKIICVDSDESNGELKELQQLCKLYDSMRKAGFAERLPELEFAGEEGVWSPLASTNRTMSQMLVMDGENNSTISANRLDDNAQDVFNFLYTSAERDNELKGGFYGRTSIGSYFMGKQVAVDGQYTKAWNEFFEGSTNGKIFIVGSVFGGMGASGIPTIGRIIKSIAQTREMELGALFVMPYFRPVKQEVRKDELQIDYDTFIPKAKMALTFYKSQNFKDIFNNMYFIGEDDLMNVPYNDHGNKQKNKANVMEIFGATAIIDFYLENSGNFCTKALKREDILTGADLNKIFKDINIFDKLMGYFQFSVLYNRYFYPCFADGRSEQDIWYRKYRDIDKDTQNIIKSVSEKFVEYIREVVCDTDQSGERNFAKYDEDLNWISHKELFEEMFRTDHLPFDYVGVFKRNKSYRFDKLDKMKLMTLGSGGMELKTGYDVVSDFLRKKDKKRMPVDFVNNIIECIEKGE